MLRRLAFVSVTVGAALVLMAGTALAVLTFQVGGTTTRQYLRTNDQPWTVPVVNSWQQVPGSGISFPVGGGTRRLVVASFSAESLCTGPGWCSVRILVSGPGGVRELAPQSGIDYAYDTDGDSWEQHEVTRSSDGYLRSGNYRLWVEAQRVNSSFFRLDDSHLRVELVAP